MLRSRYKTDVRLYESTIKGLKDRLLATTARLKLHRQRAKQRKDENQPLVLSSRELFPSDMSQKSSSEALFLYKSKDFPSMLPKGEM